MKFFWSDLHLNGHRSMLGLPGLRGNLFRDYAAWEEMVFEGIKNTTSKGDQLYLLGDFSSEPSVFVKKIKNLGGTKDLRLIIGNHDPSMAKCKEAFGFTNVKEAWLTKIKGHYTYLSHYPHLFWDKSHAETPGGAFHLYGHVHDQRTEFILEHFPEIRSLDVCPESSFRWLKEWRPFSEEDVWNILSKRAGHDDIHWCNGWRAAKVAEMNL